MSEPLPAHLAEALRATEHRRGRFGAHVLFFTETTSTNDVAARLAERGAADGTLVVASCQSAGRGRFGRPWFSPSDAGLYLSIVVRDRSVAPVLTLLAGVAVADGIRAAAGLPVEIKWPNDVVMSGTGPNPRARKVAGVLVEASTSGVALQYVVVGVGINLRPAAYPPEIANRATSIEAELGRSVDEGMVLAEILCALNDQVTSLSAGDLRRPLSRWRALAPSAEGRTVEWNGPAGVLRGTTAGIDEHGALLVHVDGRTERIIAGELRWS